MHPLESKKNKGYESFLGPALHKHSSILVIDITGSRPVVWQHASIDGPADGEVLPSLL
jgi:hypothetical protein